MKVFTVETVTVTFAGQEHTLNPAEDLTFEPSNPFQLEERLARCAQQQAFLAGAVAAKKKEVEDAKLAQEVRLASVYEEARQLLPQIKNPTETAIRYQIYRHWDDTVDSQQALNHLKFELELLEGYHQAYENAGFHLQSLLKTKEGPGQEQFNQEVQWPRRPLKIPGRKG